MKTTVIFTLSLFIFCMVVVSCSSDDEGEDFTLNGTTIAMADIAGDWNATRGVFQSTSLGPAFQVDVVDQGGTITMNIQSDGKFSITVTELGEAPETTTGRMAFDEDLLVIFFDDDPGEWEFFGIFHSEPNLSISGGNGSAEYDFDGDGSEEPANVDFEFVRI